MAEIFKAARRRRFELSVTSIIRFAIHLSDAVARFSPSPRPPMPILARRGSDYNADAVTQQTPQRRDVMPAII